MAFRTNKTPVLQEKTASGSVASFNCALNKPLVNGEFSIEAYQEGSGDPSPDNVRNIVGFNAINISHSDGVNTPIIYTKSLGETVYGGRYNSVSGVKSKMYSDIVTIDGTNNSVIGVWGATSYGYGVYFSVGSFGGRRAGIISNKFKSVESAYTQMPLYSCEGRSGSNTTITFILPNTITSLDEANAWFRDNPTDIIFPLATPIESNIGATPISTNIGDNNIFCDTGDVDLTFNDLDIAKRGSFREVFKLP